MIPQCGNPKIFHERIFTTLSLEPWLKNREEILLLTRYYILKILFPQRDEHGNPMFPEEQDPHEMDRILTKQGYTREMIEEKKKEHMNASLRAKQRKRSPEGPR